MGEYFPAAAAEVGMVVELGRKLGSDAYHPKLEISRKGARFIQSTPKSDSRV